MKMKVTVGFKGVTVAQALGRIRPVVDKLMAKASTDGEKKAIAVAMFLSLNDISGDVGMSLHDLMMEVKEFIE